MAKGTRYMPEFKAKAVRLLAESRSSYSSETNAIAGGEGSGDSAGIAAALAQPVGRDGRGGDEAVGRGRDGGAEEAAGRERAIASGERDFDDGVGFFRGQARPDTALMAAYIDEHESRFKVGPICRVLSESLDCGFLAPRGYRMLETRPVSRMRARHEALARDILQIHSDFFMAVYGYGKMHAQLVAQGWDPAEVGRGQVMNIMRELGIRGVRRGRTPVTTKPAKGTGGRPDLVDGRFEACAPNRLHVADITYVRMSNGSFGYTAFVTDVYARRIVGWACAMTMNTQELPAGVGAGDLMGRVPWWHGWSYPPQRPWHAVHRHGVHHQGYGIWDAAVDRHRRRLVRQRHGRKRRRRVQDRAGMAAQTLRGSEGPGIGDVPVGLVVELEALAPVPGLQDTGSGGNRVLSTSSGASRLTIRAEQKSGHFNWFNPAMRYQELRRTKQVTFIYMKTDEEAD